MFSGGFCIRASLALIEIWQLTPAVILALHTCVYCMLIKKYVLHSLSIADLFLLYALLLPLHMYISDRLLWVSEYIS